MSRSYRKTSILGVTKATSEKKDKKVAHHKERRIVRKMVASPESEALLPKKQEISNPWDRSKEGKIWFDARQYPKGMRK